MSDYCEIGNPAIDEEFNALFTEMQKDAYWIRFFVRPCCPAPSLEGACEQLDKLKGEVFAHEGFSDEQKAQLAETIEARKSWYGTSGLCRKRS
ncbi:MAG: hypothetical protein IKV48_02835 [Eggerthellaceae bacterium]|nr:hypothetical protein [Eggerthellaceae bacterium]